VDDACGAELTAHKPSIVLMNSAFETLYAAKQQVDLKATVRGSHHELSQKALLVHTPSVAPHLSEVGEFASDGSRTLDVLLVTKPSAAGGLYSLHPRWVEAAAALRAAGLTVEETTAGGGSAQMMTQLKRAKVVLTETTSRRYKPPEWEDALGSGCLVMSDMPGERMREYRRFSVVVPRDAKAPALTELVQKWVADAAARGVKTKEGYDVSTTSNQSGRCV
jgi:hypothetical protein